MQDHTYKLVDLVGTSTSSIEEAIQNAISRANETIRDLRWFEVVQTRGHIEDGKIDHYQVVLRVAFTLEAAGGESVRSIAHLGTICRGCRPASARSGPSRVPSKPGRKSRRRNVEPFPPWRSGREGGE